MAASVASCLNCKDARSSGVAFARALFAFNRWRPNQLWIHFSGLHEHVACSVQHAWGQISALSRFYIIGRTKQDISCNVRAEIQQILGSATRTDWSARSRPSAVLT